MTERRVIRIGHRGAAALAPENTLRSIELALELGVDMVEVDVVARTDGTLVLAHSAKVRGAATAPATLDEALALLAPSGADVQLDVKRPGYERALLDAVRRHGLVERTLVSSCFVRALRLVAELEPGVRRGLTYPFDRHGIGSRAFLQPAVQAGAVPMRIALPPRIPRMLARADVSFAALHHGVISAAAVRRCHERGVRVLAWTVDDPWVATRLAGLGVDGIVTNDPRLFAGTFSA